ncbi:MAG: hypothetical protein R3A47_06425 [Polyangiales bacterium]
MTPVCEVAIDTSVLGPLSDDKHLLDDFLAQVESKQLRVVVPFKVGWEALVCGNVTVAPSLASVLLEILSCKKTNAIVGGDYGVISTEELKGTQIFCTPKMLRDHTENLIGALWHTSQCGPNKQIVKAADDYLDKNKRIDDSKKLAVLALSCLEKGNHSLYDQFRVNPISVAIDLDDEIGLIKKLLPDETSLKTVQSTPYCYPFIMAFCMLILHRDIGQIAKTVDDEKRNNFYRKTDPNDHCDDSIAACSIYASVFLSNDKRQRRDFDFVAEKLGRNVRSSTLDDFLKRT